MLNCVRTQKSNLLTIHFLRRPTAKWVIQSWISLQMLLPFFWGLNWNFQETHAHSAKISLEMRWPVEIRRRRRRSSKVGGGHASSPFRKCYRKNIGGVHVPVWILAACICYIRSARLDALLLPLPEVLKGICLGFHSSTWTPCERQWGRRNSGNWIWMMALLVQNSQKKYQFDEIMTLSSPILRWCSLKLNAKKKQC